MTIGELKTLDDRYQARFATWTRPSNYSSPIRADRIREVATNVSGSKIKSPRIIPLFKLVRSMTRQPHSEEIPDLIALGEKVRTSMFLTAKLLFKAE